MIEVVKYTAKSEQGQAYIKYGFTPGDEPVYEAIRLFGEREIKRSLFKGEIVRLWKEWRGEPIEVRVDGAVVEHESGTPYWFLGGVVVDRDDEEHYGRRVRMFVIAEDGGGGMINGGCWQFVPRTPAGKEFISIDVR